MHNQEKDAIQMAANRKKILEVGYGLFVQRTIDGVSLDQVAKASGIGVATLYRYFGGKTDLAVEIFVWKWKTFWDAYIEEREADPGMTAAQRFAVYLDTFIELYRNHRDFLRFNQFFNVYMQGIKVDQKQQLPYESMIDGFADHFREIWEQGEKDGTLRTETPWQKVFSATLHIMLAAATRYAVGLMYQPKEAGDPEEELVALRNLLYREYAKDMDLSGHEKRDSL